MTERAVFCSYARRDAEAVSTIATELDRLGQRAWLDERLSGGQSWWDTILGQVRTCDCFLFALSDASLRSRACMAELEYAHRLDRTILPVAVGPVIDQLLPPYLAETQRVEAGDTHQLARALLSLPPQPPLPDPLPDPPPVPISYLDGLASQIGRDELTTNEQRNLEYDLKHRLSDPDEREAAAALLRRLRQHPSVNAWVAAEIDADLAEVEPAEAEHAEAEHAEVEPPVATAEVVEHHPDSRRIVVPPPPAPEPRPERRAAPPAPPARERAHDHEPRPHGTEARRSGKGGLIAVLVLVVVLAVAGGIAWAIGSGDDDAPSNVPVPTDTGDGESDPGGETDTSGQPDTTGPPDTPPPTGTDPDPGGAGGAESGDAGG